MSSVAHEYVKATPESKRLFERAFGVFPSGSTRSTFVIKPYAPYIVKGKGCRIWDVDDREYIDYANNMGPLILGHCHPKVNAAVTRQLETFSSGAPTELEIQLAERVQRLVPGAECVQFFPSGTEACAFALRLVRAYTGKEKFIMCGEGYHGSSDHFLGRHSSSGIPKDTLDKALYIPYNNAHALERMVKSHKDELAAVFLEPVLGRYGIAPKEGYLKAVREITQEHSIPLVLDEVVTGFRIAPGGAQERLKIRADVATFGKILGGGFGSGGITFPKEMGKLLTYGKSPTLFMKKPNITRPGTFNANAVTMAAGLATLDELTPAAYRHLDRLGDRIRDGLRKTLASLGIRARVTGLSSIFHLHFTNEEVVDAETADTADPLFVRIYDLAMLTKGVNLAKAHCSYCSTPMVDTDIEQTLQAMNGTLTQMLPVIRQAAPDLLS